jgi:hypothetical protein
MIEQLKDFPANIVACVCKVRVTKADYDTVLVPAVVKALERHNKVRFYTRIPQIGEEWLAGEPGSDSCWRHDSRRLS